MHGIKSNEKRVLVFAGRHGREPSSRPFRPCITLYTAARLQRSQNEPGGKNWEKLGKNWKKTGKKYHGYTNKNN